MSSSPVVQAQYGVVIEDFTAEGPFEIDVKSGDLIQIISHANSKWTYVCRLSDFQNGYIPTLFYSSLGTKVLISYLINQISSPKSSSHSNISLSSSSSSSCSSLLAEKPNDLLSDSISSISSFEAKSLNVTPAKSTSKSKQNRTDPDGGDSSDLSFQKKDANHFKGVPQTIKIYENIEPNDYEINILHLYNQPSTDELSSSSSLRTLSSRYEITIPEVLEIPRRLFIDTGARYRLLSQELKDSFEKLTLV